MFNAIRGYFYAGLGIVFLGLVSYAGWQRHKVESLKKDLALTEMQTEVLESVAKSKNKALDVLEGELKACATKRAEANDRAIVAEQHYSSARIKSEQANSELVESLRQERLKSPSCGHLSPSATKLLIEAARSANRDPGSR